jgi:diguanylate cyclase (GGDEF)-like protein
MGNPPEHTTPSRTAARLAVVGMSVAVVALGALAVWAALATQREADGLSRVGVQTTGQLRSVQALYVIRTESEALQEAEADEFTQRLEALRAAQRLLPEALTRMETGTATEPIRVAGLARPVAQQLDPAIERFLTDPRGDVLCRCGDDGDDTAEDAMEELIVELEAMLNDSGSDPAELLDNKLANVTDTGLAIRATASALIPMGLLGVLACGWLLRSYRRRSEAVMQAALDMTAREARTDQLTGLPNRRALLEELDRRIAKGGAFTFALADLNGFKHYNDTFGHPAGDALLRRLGGKLAVAWEGHGFAARLGGDEFCVVAENLAPEQLQAMLHGALSERGDGFDISAVSGLATVPVEVTDSSAAIGLADTRLYAAKAAFHAGGDTTRDRRAAGGRAGHAAPAAVDGSAMSATSTPRSSHNQHFDRVARLAVAGARALGVPDDDLPTIEQAGQLHDIGKSAIPAGILAKRGPLTPEELQFVRRHSLIGERLLNGIDVLKPTAAIVRATHERWDGTGYPDRLAGDAIPIGARIIAVADAFCAMISERPHAPARPVAEALAELERCAGTQFDPDVAHAMIAVITADEVSEAMPTHAG